MYQFNGWPKATKLTAAQIIPENILLLQNEVGDEGLRQIEISPTDVCNQKCGWCFTVTARASKYSLSPDLLRKYIDEFISKGGISVVISGGGEPLLYKAIYEEISEFDGLSILNYCIKKRLVVGLITNGANLKKVTKSVDIKKLAFIRISLDSLSEELYSRFHGVPKKHHKLVIEGIESARRKKKQSPVPAIGISFVVDDRARLNCRDYEIAEIAEFARQLDLEFVQFKHLHTYATGEAEKTMAKIHRFAMKQYWGSCEFWVQKYKTPAPDQICYVPTVIQSVGNNNKRFPCCHLFGDETFLAQNKFYPRGKHIVGCPSKVCRYVSVNAILTALRSGNLEYKKARKTLNKSLELFGFHPYRLFPTAPDLHFPVTNSVSEASRTEALTPTIKANPFPAVSVYSNPHHIPIVLK